MFLLEIKKQNSEKCPTMPTSEGKKKTMKDFLENAQPQTWIAENMMWLTPLAAATGPAGS